jgi:cyanophycinase-like exopeptidase
MALFAWRLRIVSARPLGLSPGLGALEGYVAVPHFDRFVGRWNPGRRFAERHRRRLDGLGIIGIDEETALVVRDGRAQVLGPGTVTLGDARSWRRHRAGQQVVVDLGILTATRPHVVPDARSVA